MIEIEITQEDIDRGEPESVTRCPIAQAIQRQCGRPAWVDQDGVILCNEKGVEVESYALSPEGREFIQTVDAGKPVSPTKIHLLDIAQDTE